MTLRNEGHIMKTKNQHYIPQSILVNFANNKGQLFEALVKQEKIYSTNYRQSMSERFTYEHPDLEVNLLENAFGKIESYFAPAMRKIISDLDSNSVSIDTIKMQADTFMKDYLVFYYRSGALLNEYAFDGLNVSVKIPLMLEKIIDSKYLSNLSETIKSFYDFAIIKSEGCNFILSDQYVSTAALSIKGQYSNISNRHLGLKDVLMLIPLSSKYYIVYSNGNRPNFIAKNKVNLLSDEDVCRINKTIMSNSYVKCIGLHKSPLEKSIEYYNYESPSKTIVAYKSGVKTTALNKKEVFFYEEDIEQWAFFKNFMHTINKNTRRNDTCRCGSGEKYKKCCLLRSERNYLIVENMYKKDHLIKIKAHPTSYIEKALEEYSYFSNED